MSKNKIATPRTDNYRQVRAEAQKKANEFGYDYGIEPDAIGFHSFMLPRRENRHGYELRCEVVMCENLEKRQPGHGPVKR
jgi:hypothetical protein